MGDELQSFDVFGKHLTTSDLSQNYEYDRKNTCDKPYKCDICGNKSSLKSQHLSCLLHDNVD
jgi:hypothetical protein